MPVFRFDPTRTSAHCPFPAIPPRAQVLCSIPSSNDKKSKETCCNTSSSGEADSIRPYVLHLALYTFSHASPRQVMKPLAPFMAASAVTFYLVNQMQDLGVRCTSHHLPLLTSVLTLTQRKPMLRTQRTRTPPRSRGKQSHTISVLVAQPTLTGYRR